MQRKSSCSFTPLLRAASNRFCGECSQLSDGPRVSASKPQMPRERGSTMGWNKVEMRPSRTSSVSSCVAASSLRKRKVGESGRTSDMTAKRNCGQRSEEHTSELQSRLHLVCRLLLEKKKKQKNHH